MSTVKTSKTMSKTAAAAPKTRSVVARLDELEFDPITLEGREDRIKKIDDLLASIPAEGVLQSLAARPYGGPKPKKGPTPKWWIKFGQRRLATLRKLLEMGGSIQGVKVTGAYEVHLLVRDDDDASAFSASVAENIQRLPETPVAEFRHFATMAKTMPIKEIAGRFGVTERRVEQRLRLAALHPTILAALEKNEIGLDAAQAFTIEPDQAKQLAVWKRLPEWQRDNAYSIKAALETKIVRADSKLAKILGKEAYVKAGGKIYGDVFNEKASYWISPDVIDKLIKSHWKEQIVKWEEEGWLFVMIASEFHPQATPFSVDRLELIGRKKNFTPEQRAVSGVIYWPDGSYEPKLGVVRPGTKVPRALRGGVSSLSPAGGDREGSKPAASLDDPGRTVSFDLSGKMTRALKEKLAREPMLALRVLLASIHSQTFSAYDRGTPITINAEFRKALADDDVEAEEQADDRVPFAKALELINGMPDEQLLTALAPLVAMNLTVVDGTAGARNGKEALVQFVDPDAEPVFDADAYFAGITKPLIQLAWSEMMNPLAGDKALPDGKKSDMAKAAAAKANETRWLPPQLRSPSYTGPGSNKPKEPPIAANEDEPQQLVAAE